MIYRYLLVITLLFLSCTYLSKDQKSFKVSADSSPYVGFFSPSRTWTAAGNANLLLPQPDPRSGDLMVAVISIRPATSTVNTPTGWTALGSWTGTDGGAEGIDAGSVSMYWFYKVADGTEGLTNVTFTENGTTSVWLGTILQVRSSTGTYDLSLGGYSINGDATNWNGTLDTDIGLTSGDLAIVVGSQVGDASNTSAWDLTATGITSKSTIFEHGEFTSTTGNDIEMDLATTQVWAGTNTATPTVTLTQSGLVSGAVTALRVRQGAGTNRTDTWVRAAGGQVIGTTSVAVPYPEHSVGEILLLLIGNKYNTATPATPSGWTSLGTLSGGTGTGTDVGSERITVFYKQVASLTTGTQSVTVTLGNSTIGQMVSVHKDSVDNWILDSDFGADNTANASWSATGSGIDLSSARGGDIVLIASAMNTDAYLYSSHAMSASGITFGDVTRTAEYRSVTGTDMTLELVTARVSTGTQSNVAPTFTSTASGSTTGAPLGASSFIKIIGNDAPAITVDDPDSANDTVGQGQNYTIVYDLADSDDTATVAFYYDTDASGLNGMAISGGCAAAAEGQNASCNWDTTGVSPGDYYIYGITSDSLNPSISDYSPGVATIEVLSITITSDGTISYGLINTSESKSTVPADLNDLQTIQNNGSGTVDLLIKGQNSGNWTLGATIGSEQYVHKFCNATSLSCATPPTNFTALTTSYQSLATSVTTSSSVDLHLQILTPSSTSFFTQQDVSVTIMATVN